MRIFKSENFIIFSVVFLAAAAAGFYINFHLKFIFGDALVRSYHAYSVFFGHEPKLSAIGFIWPPLQTLLQLPLVLVPQFNNFGIAGNFFTAIFLGLSTVYLNLLGRFFKVNKAIILVCLILFVTNPLIFFYGTNGMSEIIGIAFLLMTLYHFLKHLATKSAPSLIISSLFFVCAIMTRWEIGLLLFVLLPTLVYTPFVNKKYSLREAESSLVLFIVPVVFVMTMWLGISWLITGSFLQSASQVDNNLSDSATSIESTVGPPEQLLGLALMRIFLLSPLFLVMLFSILPNLRNKLRLETVVVLGFSLSMLFAHTILFSLGRTVGELRYFIYVIPFTYILLFLRLKDTLIFPIKRWVLKPILFWAFVIIMLISSGSTFKVMSSQTFNNQEYIFVKALKEGHNYSQYFNYENDEKIAKYITENVNNRSVLVDDSVGFGVIYFTKKPNLFIQTLDTDFRQTLLEPQKHAKYMLVSNSKEDQLNKQHVRIFEDGRSFLVLEKDFGNWKLYKLL